MLRRSFVALALACAFTLPAFAGDSHLPGDEPPPVICNPGQVCPGSTNSAVPSWLESVVSKVITQFLT